MSACSHSGPCPHSGRSRVVKIPTVDCLCTANSIVCHHRGSIWMNAAFMGYKRVRGFARKKKVPMIKLTTPPPRPEPTAHLAVLRNPTHPEWTARPGSYLSPALCNISPIYVRRVIEPEARRQLMEPGFFSRDTAFSLGYVQRKELQHELELEARFKREKAKREEAKREEERREEEQRKAENDLNASPTSSLSTSPSSSSFPSLESITPFLDGEKYENSRLKLVRCPARQPLALGFALAHSRGKPISVPAVQAQIARDIKEAMSQDIPANVSRNTRDIVRSRPIDIPIPNKASSRSNFVGARRLIAAARSKISRAWNAWHA
ncbi:hypothetical protein DSL72_002241 [Monilinia vaccinii-corymbosi]|uniref:Uncharacterized protein n=1 Tax=Monilinia vaccinii-corymbosi TaxID=61207 RepID=A0A8A3PC13_9HELO|nr:hypothetical protein DSL72_002241 [Monilinia vaccinii-corymbosi]